MVVIELEEEIGHFLGDTNRRLPSSKAFIDNFFGLDELFNEGISRQAERGWME